MSNIRNDKSNIRNEKIKQIIELEGDIALAAKLYLELGFRPVPLSIETSKPTVDLDNWINVGITADGIDQHFSNHPDDVIGLHPGNDLVIIQISSEEADASLSKIEQHHNAVPKFIIETPEGECHYFRKEEGVSVNNPLSSTGKHLDGIIVKSGAEILPVPPCDGVSCTSAWLDDAQDLTEIYQHFLDDILDWQNQNDAPQVPAHKTDNSIPSTLAAYGINKLFANIENAPEAEALFDGFIMRGEMATIYAEAGSGKTLLLFHLIKQAIENGFKNPTHFGYINKDDSGPGLMEKIKFADTLNIQVIADVNGHYFGRDAFLTMLHRCINQGEAEKTVFVVDTLKKLADINDKDRAAKFYSAVRPFTLAGGTLVFLAHTNKYKNDGKSVYAGTSDNIQDVDAAFSLDIISEGNAELQERVVLLECVKGRMASVPNMMFGYNASENMKWTDRLNTVRRISDEEYEEILNKSSRSKDLEIITSISETLRINGQMQKMKLAKSVCEDTGCSRKESLAVLESYTGPNPDKHEWNFQVGPRGAKIYNLL